MALENKVERRKELFNKSVVSQYLAGGNLILREPEVEVVSELCVESMLLDDLRAGLHKVVAYKKKALREASDRDLTLMLNGVVDDAENAVLADRMDIMKKDIAVLEGLL